MDIDRYIELHRSDWSRLDALVRKGVRGLNRLTADELDELLRLYLRVSSQLSAVRTRYGDPALIDLLTRLVARAGSLIYSTQPGTLRAVRRFFTETFPAAVWHARRPMMASLALLAIPAIVIGVWLWLSPVAYQAAMPAAMREAYLNRDFEGYYSSAPASVFGSIVFVNNVKVAILAFAGGITLCLFTAWILLNNGALIGYAAGIFAAAGAAPKFWGLVLPHGLLELTSVVIAGGAGLRVGWTIIDPGDRPRRRALAEEARRAVVIAVGLIPAFLVAGLIEANVTPSGLPTWARVGIGAVVEVAFLTYLVVQGRRAETRGRTGALRENEDISWRSSWQTATAPSPSTSP